MSLAKGTDMSPPQISSCLFHHLEKAVETQGLNILKVSLCRPQLGRIGMEAERCSRQSSSGFSPGLTVVNKAPAKSRQDQVPQPLHICPKPCPPEIIPI